MSNTLDLLFFGDIVGRPGRDAVRCYLGSLGQANLPDVVVANVENASHGFGLTEKNYRELKEIGIDIMTSGNHIWDKKEIVKYMDEVGDVLRPFNMIGAKVGRGHGLFEVRGHKIGVMNAIGQVFMGQYNSPFEGLEQMVTELKTQTPIVFMDLHAEATAEKVAIGQYLDTLGVSAFTGTHTHVQTADNKILPNGMGYITDTGFNGAYQSVIGMESESAISRLKEPYPVRLDVPETTFVQINATKYTLDTQTGRCLAINRVQEVFDTRDYQ